MMDVTRAIRERRALRSLSPAPITRELVEDLARHAQLAPSCFNSQPTRLAFVFEPKMLENLQKALSEGNRWAFAASLIVAVFSREEDDCVIKDREYHLFDDGQATAFLLLRATELGLVAHPIAGFSPKKVKDILGIPDEYQVITLVMVGKKSETISPALSDKQVEWEKERPARHPLEKIVFLNRYNEKGE